MFRKLKRYIKDPYHEIGYDLMREHPNWLPDKWYLKLLWKFTYGYELDLKHPKTFSEKLQWLKLYDRKPIYTTMVDKYRAKQWIADKIGEQYVIPTLAVYNSVDEIDLDKLPEKFVLKCNHDSGSVVICKDKSMFNLEEAKKKLGEGLVKNYYWVYREWPYQRVKHVIIAEPLIATPEDLKEFKLFCFNGHPKIFQSICDRICEKGPILQHFSIEGERLEINDKNYKSRQSQTEADVFPSSLETMAHISKQLSKSAFFIRVDFYDVKGKIYVGELTLYESGGFVEFEPKKYNRILGDWIKLPTDN